MAAYAATVALDKPNATRLGNSPMGLLSGSVNLTNYNSVKAEIVAITGQFNNTQKNLRVLTEGLSSNGYSIQWDTVAKAFKAYDPGAVTLTLGAPAAASAISATGSPMTYTNNDGVPEEVTLTGGTTTAFTITRGGFTSANLYTTTPMHVMLAPGDSFTVTYSVAPTMEKLPFGAYTAAIAAPLAEVANDVNIGTFDFIAIGQLG